MIDHVFLHDEAFFNVLIKDAPDNCWNNLSISDWLTTQLHHLYNGL
jgi:hypothetical protein